jgi:hypothetical protein
VLLTSADNLRWLLACFLNVPCSTSQCYTRHAWHAVTAVTVTIANSYQLGGDTYPADPGAADPPLTTYAGCLPVCQTFNIAGPAVQVSVTHAVHNMQ